MHRLHKRRGGTEALRTGKIYPPAQYFKPLHEHCLLEESTYRAFVVNYNQSGFSKGLNTDTFIFLYFILKGLLLNLKPKTHSHCGKRKAPSVTMLKRNVPF